MLTLSKELLSSPLYKKSKEVKKASPQVEEAHRLSNEVFNHTQQHSNSHGVLPHAEEAQWHSTMAREAAELDPHDTEARAHFHAHAIDSHIKAREEARYWRHEHLQDRHHNAAVEHGSALTDTGSKDNHLSKLAHKATLEAGESTVLASRPTEIGASGSFHNEAGRANELSGGALDRFSEDDYNNNIQTRRLHDAASSTHLRLARSHELRADSFDHVGTPAGERHRQAAIKHRVAAGLHNHAMNHLYGMINRSEKSSTRQVVKWKIGDRVRHQDTGEIGTVHAVAPDVDPEVWSNYYQDHPVPSSGSSKDKKPFVVVHNDNGQRYLTGGENFDPHYDEPQPPSQEKSFGEEETPKRIAEAAHNATKRATSTSRRLRGGKYLGIVNRTNAERNYDISHLANAHHDIDPRTAYVLHRVASSGHAEHSKYHKNKFGRGRIHFTARDEHDLAGMLHGDAAAGLESQGHKPNQLQVAQIAEKASEQAREASHHPLLRHPHYDEDLHAIRGHSHSAHLFAADAVGLTRGGTEAHSLAITKQRIKWHLNAHDLHRDVARMHERQLIHAWNMNDEHGERVREVHRDAAIKHHLAAALHLEAVNGNYEPDRVRSNTEYGQQPLPEGPAFNPNVTKSLPSSQEKGIGSFRNRGHPYKPVDMLPPEPTLLRQPPPRDPPKEGWASERIRDSSGKEQQWVQGEHVPNDERVEYGETHEHQQPADKVVPYQELIGAIQQVITGGHEVTQDQLQWVATQLQSMKPVEVDEVVSALELPKSANPVDSILNLLSNQMGQGQQQEQPQAEAQSAAEEEKPKDDKPEVEANHGKS